jgi:hypothetical protein
VGVPGAAYVGRGLDELGESLQRIQNGADAAEKLRLEGQASAGFQSLIQKHDLETADPEEYKAALAEALPTLHSETLNQASNPRVRRAVEASLADNYGRAQKVAELGYYKKKQDKMAGDFVVAEDQMIKAAVGVGDENRKGVEQMHSAALAQMVHSGGMKFEEANKRKIEFNKKVLMGTANTEIEADPTIFLRNLAGGKYEMLDSDTRRSLLRSANAQVTSAITMQKRDQELKREQAEREIQVMFDQGVSSNIIDQRLKALSASGILDRNERKFWDEKLIRGEKADDAAQVANATKLENQFTDAYPTSARVKEFRNLKREMERSGALGDSGAAKFGAMLNQVERSLHAEARAERGEQRAIANQNERDKPDKMTSPQAVQLIGRNFPRANPNKPISTDHKADMNSFVNRVTINGEDAGTVAREIYAERQKSIKVEEDRKKAQVEAAKADPKAKEILDALKALNTKK